MGLPRKGPLHGFRIVEIAGIGPAPMCAMLLADLGAEVLRVERMQASGLGIESACRRAASASTSRRGSRS